MRPGEFPIDASLVRRLLAAQFPRWAELPLKRFPSAGTVNALYRLGDDLAVRLPRIEGGAEDVAKEAHWVPRLAPLLPAAVPEILATGTPGEGYPWPWMVQRWLDGEPPHAGRLTDPLPLAADLGAFVAALRRVRLPDGPTAYRGVPLSTADAMTRAALDELRGTIDTSAATAAWEAALAAPAWTGPPLWVHSDLMPGNMLTRGGGSTPCWTSAPSASATRPAISSRPGTCSPPRRGTPSARRRAPTTPPGHGGAAGPCPWRSSSSRTTASPIR